jgi:hypothetical protein
LAQLRWTPDNILIRALGAVGLAGANTVLNNRVNQVTSFLRNGDMLDWLIVAADLFNVAPDGTQVGDALDAATDAAIYDLSSSLFRNRLLPVPSLGSIFGAPAATPAQTPAGAAATGTPSPSTAAVATPIPAASMSAAGTVATSGY